MNFLETFLKLTEYTVPFGYESELEPLLPDGYQKDSIGNYFYQIGNSETLFTSHLDTACDKREKINHVIDGNIVKTDGTTILGGDNKAGCVVLFYLIENRIPGTYYFFLGEEMAVHKNYPHGSLLAIEERPDFFTKFKRVISFDRKEKGQLVTRQLGKNCCSEEFANRLIDDFGKNGVKYEKDKTGYYTDSAFFADIVPEIVNLSVGVWNEHNKSEYVDISYIESVSRAAVKVNWESLPVGRKVESKYQIDTRRDNTNEYQIGSDHKLFEEIFNILDEMYFVCHEFRSYQNFLSHFIPGRKYHFTKWHEDEDLEISVDNGIVNCNGEGYNLDEFKRFLGIEKMNIDDFSHLMLDEFIKNKNKLSDARFNFLLYQKGGFTGFGSDNKTLSDKLKELGYNMNKIGKGYEIIKESHIIKNYNLFMKSISYF